MAHNPLPFTTLDAVTANTNGVAKDLEGTFRTHSLFVFVTGDPTHYTVGLQGSHDGIHWTGGPGINDGGSTAYVTTDDHLYRYVRANLSNLSGGSSPTVTATIASA